MVIHDLGIYQILAHWTISYAVTLKKVYQKVPNTLKTWKVTSDKRPETIEGQNCTFYGCTKCCFLGQKGFGGKGWPFWTCRLVDEQSLR